MVARAWWTIRWPFIAAWLATASLLNCVGPEPVLAGATQPGPLPFVTSYTYVMTVPMYGVTQPPGDDSVAFATTQFVQNALNAIAVVPDQVGDIAYTIPAIDQLVVTHATFTASRIWTLPPAASYQPGAPLEVFDQFGTLGSSQTLTIAANTGDTVNGGASVVLKAQYVRIQFISDGVSVWRAGVASPLAGGTGSATAPTSAQLLVGQSTGLYAPQTVSGDVTLSSAGVVNVTGLTNALGVTGGGTACAGCVGERIASKILVGSAVSLTSTTTANITTLSLTAGDWDVTGSVAFTGSATNVTFCGGGISTTSATLPASTADYTVWLGRSGAFTIDVGFPIPLENENLSSPTTIYLVERCTFASGTASGYGQIVARRIR